MPTGSMAPTLLGNHHEVICPNCGFRFALGLDEDGPGRPAGLPQLRRRPTWTTARRSSAAATASWCRSSSTTSAARALGGRGLPLPGRPVAGLRQARGRAARTSRSRSSAATSGRRPDRAEDAERAAGDARSWCTTTTTCPATRPIPALGCSGGAVRASDLPTRLAGGRRPVRPRVGRPMPTVRSTGSSYRHWDPDRGKYWPVHDFNAYNGGDLRGENRVTDLMLEARLDRGRGRPRRRRADRLRLRPVRGRDSGRRTTMPSLIRRRAATARLLDGTSEGARAAGIDRDAPAGSLGDGPPADRRARRRTRCSTRSTTTTRRSARVRETVRSPWGCKAGR